MAECTNCQRDLSDVDSVYLGQDSYADRVRVGQFCTYACLTQYVEDNDLVESDE